MASLQDFMSHVTRSQLMTAGEIERALADFERAPEDDAGVRFARQLIAQKKLTTYQARKLLNGAIRGFFLGGYRILRPLGEGGMGKVFLAEKEGTADLVAIKVRPPKKAAEEEQAIQRFRREMDLSRRVNHPNLARTIDVGRDDDVYFMILEYIPGVSLYQAVREDGGGPLRVTDAARFFIKVLDGLEAAHRAGLVHRDLKPSNIMITPDGDARVLDLGLARATEDNSPPLTRPNLVVGTLDYISPEQIVNASSADCRSDLYSIGCTLYFTLAGRPPFDGGEIINKIFKQRMEDPEPLERVSRGVPAAFAAIVKKLMAKNPEERYQNCEELKADLRRWTDPAKVRAILGAEAEAARVFRPPPPTLFDDDLRLLTEPASEKSGFSIRDFGDAEPSAPPWQRPAPPGLVAAIIRPAGRPSNSPTSQRPRGSQEESNWLTKFIAVVVIAGLAAILAITLLK